MLKEVVTTSRSLILTVLLPPKELSKVMEAELFAIMKKVAIIIILL